jgi:hypothetical protein
MDGRRPSCGLCSSGDRLHVNAPIVSKGESCLNRDFRSAIPLIALI